MYFCFAVPPDLFLLGCIFMIVDYDSSMPEEVMMWQRIISSSGGEVETVYGPRVTHVLSETQKSATFQRVTSAMSLLLLALFF
jgi:PAX-interacting protein 1